MSVDDLPDELISGGVTTLHGHPKDETFNHNQVVNFQRSTAFTSTSGSPTLVAGDDWVLVDTTGGTRIVTLPVSNNSGKEYVVIKKVAANTLTISASGSDTVNGAASINLTAAYEAKRLKAISGGYIAV